MFYVGLSLEPGRQDVAAAFAAHAPHARLRWGELDDDNRDVLWLWILRILDNVCRITVPV